MNKVAYTDNPNYIPPAKPAPTPPLIPASDLDAIEAEARLAVSIGGNQETLKRLARNVLALLEAVRQ